MSSILERLEAEALQLSLEERARLVEKLIASLDVDPEVEEAWAAENAVMRKSRAELSQYFRGRRRWPS
jgi:hypothetical protein